jgi:hypothetical protein
LTREYDPNEDDFDPQKTIMTQRNVMMDFGEGRGLKGPSNPYSQEINSLEV